jgi:hypothetical protein
MIKLKHFGFLLREAHHLDVAISDLHGCHRKKSEKKRRKRAERR